MFNKEWNFQNIFKQESSKISTTHFLPSKNQARFLKYFFTPSKNQARQKLLEKAQSRSRQEFWHPKARDQEFQASLALLYGWDSTRGIQSCADGRSISMRFYEVPNWNLSWGFYHICKILYGLADKTLQSVLRALQMWSCG